MSKARHKPTPAPPKWYWPDSDNCWQCKFRYNQRGCTGCKFLKKAVAKEQSKKKYKFDF